MRILFQKFSQSKSVQKGFTLLEILLVVAAIAILAGIVILAINPTKQLGDTRNAQRRSDVNTVLNAVYQYAIDNSGSLPPTIPNGTCASLATAEICKTGAASCASLVDLSAYITTSSKYLVSVPTDPSGATTNGSGYRIVTTTNSRVTVCAPSAEQSATISVTR